MATDMEPAPAELVREAPVDQFEGCADGGARPGCASRSGGKESPRVTHGLPPGRSAARTDGPSRGVRLDFRFHFLSHRTFGDIPITTGLQVNPALQRRPEIPPETWCGIDRHAPTAEHDVIQPWTRRPEHLGELVHAEPDGRGELVT